ncbi:amino acid adenylation domain-containing protein [Streptomyces boninensis]|uniref:amino acid adenylation domain-containing protein n=1 Tax=Streptomyces boninensis TaxID=2039455 RepID=UPI003B21C0B8
MNDRTQAESVPGRRPPLLPELFAAQAARTPHAPAVVRPGEETIRYGDLHERALQLAGRLGELGVTPGEPVGVCLPRTPDLVAALLGVWLAGGAYVPLDPAHPAGRRALVVADAGARLIVAQRETAGLAAEGNARAVIMEDLADAYSTPDAAAVTVPLDPAQPAYLLHTSGSTGRPKGVVVPHAGIANRVRWLAHRHQLGPDDRMLLKTTVGFDAAGLELFAPLISGGSVVLAPEGAEFDPAALLRAVADGGVSVLQGVPSVYGRLADESGWADCTRLRLLFSAGEPLHAELCRRLLKLAPSAEIWNTYGPTEASVDITEHRYDPAQETGPVPIGKPIGGLRVRVLDAAGREVPAGVPGELYAGGAGLALGYWGAGGRTAERFVPDPRGPEGARLYRTGDRVRRRTDGVLEYLGRLDGQLKVNGVRIEPGEVEAALAAHPWVRAAAAGVSDDGSGGRRLVAWVQSRGEQLRPDELRMFLRRTLPDAMVPQVFVPVTEFPLTPNGKIDRAALPDPAAEAAPGGLVPVRNAAERRVAEEWSDLLGTPADEIGALHDFFQLGGSSLMLTRLAERLSRAAGGRIELRRLFTATTVADQAELIAAPAATDPAPETRQDAVPRTPAGLPLSPGQQGLWLLDRLRPGTGEWTAPVFITLPGSYEDATITAALEQLASRHEILRTRYELRGAEPVQIADPPGHRRVPVRFARAQSAAALRRVAQEEFAAGYDLEHGGVWRAAVVRGEDAVTVLLSIHHIACDGWSSVVLERDLKALAAAVHDGTEAELPPLPLQYADHAVHQRRALAAGAAETELAHWRETLDGLTPLDLPADRPRPATRDGSGAAHVFTVPAAIAERAARIGRERGATLQQTLLTSFAALVARLTGRWDVPVGVPVAGRERPETADVVGFFLNTLVLRCEAPADAPFTTAVEHVRDRAREAFAHQAVPFDRVVEELGAGGDSARTPLYQVMFDLHEEGRTGTAVAAGELRAFRDAWRSARTDLTLVVQPQPDGSLLGMVEYATALFDTATVERFADCWLRLLESVTDDPQITLDAAEILPDGLRAEILRSGEGTPAAAVEPGESSVFAAIVASAGRDPRATAVVCGDEEWTYAQLLRRAAGYARRLTELDAGPEATVGVMLPRTPELLAALLGVWQSGASYVTLDPAAPDDRLGYLLADAGAHAVIADPAGVRRLTGLHAAPGIGADEQLPAGPARYPGCDPDRQAYVIYTSGSTGRPKGVAVSHGSLLRMLSAARADLGFGSGSTWLALAQPTFDISCTELFLPLLAGGRVVLARECELGDHGAQLALLDTHAVSHIQVAPPHWQMLIDAGLGERPGLTGLTGGEPTPPALARELARRLGRFVNEYGPTETTIAATRWQADEAARAVPIGRPYPHVTARVLDSRLRPVPYGTTGELCIGGGGAARGYHGRPGMTAAAFVPDPYGPAGSRLYRSGDLARMRPDGTLEFAGRADGQAKVRGRRVETGEVQAVLAGHPGVAAAVVTVYGSGPDAALIGYWVPGAGPLPGDGELRDHCAGQLPDYMVPALFVPIPSVPLTRHNKVDTAALPAPDLAAALADEPYTAPEGPVEEAIAAIWAEVLFGSEHAERPIGGRQGFFRIGGNSVRAARVTALIQDEFGVELPLRAVFERPTVAGLAAAVEEAVAAEIASLNDSELAFAHQEYQP